MLDKNKKSFEFPSYFGTRLCNTLKHLGITADDLIYNMDKRLDFILSHRNNGIGINSLFKITKFRVENVEWVTMYYDK